MLLLSPDFLPLYLACERDDRDGAKTFAEFREHSERRRDLVRIAGRYAATKNWRRVRLKGGAFIGPGIAEWTDFLFASASAYHVLDALLELDTTP